MVRSKLKTLSILQSTIAISKKFKINGVGFTASAVSPDRLSAVDLWVVKVLKTNTKLSATTTCCKKNIKLNFKKLAVSLLRF